MSVKNFSSKSVQKFLSINVSQVHLDLSLWGVVFLLPGTFLDAFITKMAKNEINEVFVCYKTYPVYMDVSKNLLNG